MKGSKEVSNHGNFRIEGNVNLEAAEGTPAELSLTAYAFDKAGTLVGSAKLDNKGKFNIAAKLKKPTDIEVVVGPEGDAQTLRQSAFNERYTPNNWVLERDKYILRAEILIPRDIWFPWFPARICVSGHVRKVVTANGSTQYCPVPFVKVEVFDVDREGCLWPFFDRYTNLLKDRTVVRLPDLLRPKPFPFPTPIPPPPDPFGPISKLKNPVTRVGLNPQPLPPRELHSARIESDFLSAAAGVVGEMKMLSPEAAKQFENLTFTSRIAPWEIFTRCFYSKQLVCETTTDCNGYFRCCFRWWPFHFRNGRLRFDSRPDIIIRVTQIINGVPTVIYMDPYSSTRWNTTNTHIDLFLDDEDIQCGQGCAPHPEGKATFFTRVGNDEVYKIDQTNGLFSEGALQNWAYGSTLNLHAAFGDQLTNGAFYYRLSYKKSGSFTPITSELSDTRVDKISFNSESHILGPVELAGVKQYYEIRNFDSHYWYNPDWIGYLNTENIEPDEGKYTIRLEVFDAAGNKLTSAIVDYRDGTVPPPGPLPPMADRCDLVLQVDNKAPILGLDVPDASGECGVVPFSEIPGLTIDINVNQENSRLYTWALSYVKGITGGSGTLDSDIDGSGLAVPVVKSVSAASMTAGLTGTCAFSLTVSAWPLVRNGFSAINHRSKTAAIAIEKCPE